MKKKKKIVLFIIALLVILYTIFWWDEIIIKTQLRIRCWKDYHSFLNMENVYIDDEEEEMRMVFICENSISDKNEEILFELYHEAYDIIFNVENRKYDSYKLELRIKEHNSYAVIIFGEITEDKTSITVHNNVNSITIGDIANNCPETVELSIAVMQYESLEEFNGFKNLKRVWCQYDIIDIEEEKYILSLFPECEIWDENDY